MGNNCMNCNKDLSQKPDQPPQTFKEIAQKEEGQTFLNAQDMSQAIEQSRKGQAIKRVKIRNIQQTSESQEASNALIEDRPKSREDRMMIMLALNKHFIFTNLSEDDRDSVIKTMKHFTMKEGDIVFEQGQPAKYYFILIQGSLDVIVNGRNVNKIKPGDGFGELALLHDTPRSATVSVTENSEMWGVERATFRQVIEQMNNLNFEENLKFIETVPLLQGLTPQQKESLANALVYKKYSVNQAVVKEGEDGDRLFIIKEGVVSCRKGNVEIRRLYKGDFFGEIALLYNAKRTATVVAVEGDIKVIYIMRETLNKLFGSHLQQVLYRNTQREALERSHALNKLTPEQVEKLIDQMVVTEFENGEQVIAKGTFIKEKLYIVLKGQLKKQKTGAIVAEKGQCLGDNCMMEDSSIQFDDDVIAFQSQQNDKSVICTCTKAQFETQIGGKLEKVVKLNEAASVFEEVSLLRHLTSSKKQMLTECLKTQKFENGSVIFEQKSIGDKFYIIKKGKVQIEKNGQQIRIIHKHDYFGERAIIFEEQRTATVKCDGPVACWVLSKQDFFNILDEPMRQHLIERINMQDENIKVEQLILLKTLGKGMFGSVFLTKHPQKEVYYALKCVSRGKIEKYAIQENLIMERQILMQIDHPLIMKLVKTQKDRNRLYFITEFVRGMDLFDVLRAMGLLSNADSQFYVASLLVILNYLHDRDIIYRDLKPENIMVDMMGYVKLIDFGTAKIVRGRTFTVVGTPHYMSPEVIVGKGYGTAADYWSVGIILYEFLCGGVPFGEEEEDPWAIYEKVLEYKLRYPPFVGKNFPAKPMIEQLLQRSPQLRTGGSFQNLKSHNWFEGFDWDQLNNRTMKSPYQPQLPDFQQEVQKLLKKKKKQSINEEIAVRLQLQAEESEGEEGEVDNTELRKYKQKIPKNWDEDF